MGTLLIVVVVAVVVWWLATRNTKDSAAALPPRRSVTDTLDGWRNWNKGFGMLAEHVAELLSEDDEASDQDLMAAVYEQLIINIGFTIVARLEGQGISRAEAMLQARDEVTIETAMAAYGPETLRLVIDRARGAKNATRWAKRMQEAGRAAISAADAGNLAPYVGEIDLLRAEDARSVVAIFQRLDRTASARRTEPR